MVTSTEPPATPEQVIEQRLIDCGLNQGGFTVKYKDYLQSIEIVITPAAGAREEHFSCIRESTGHEIVTFDDGTMQVAYLDYASEIVRPQMLADATAQLAERQLLAGFPEKNSFPTLELYAEALETHSGLQPRSALRVNGDSIVFDPPRNEVGFSDFTGRYSDLMAALMFAVARGDFKNFEFIGNEKFVELDGE